MAKPYLTTDDLVATLQRKISAPAAQAAFTYDDFVAFLNDELAISLVPNVLLMHEEFFVDEFFVPLRSRQNKYSIPDRAIGMKLRDVFWQDPYGNLFQMSQVTEEDKAFFQRSIGANQAIHKYYIQGNDVVLTPTPDVNPTGSLVLVYFLRPNQLVANSRAATVTGFSKSITLSNASLTPGDTFTITDTFVDLQGNVTQTVKIFTAVTGAPSTPLEFHIGATDSATANNLQIAINANSSYTATTISGSNVVVISYPLLEAAFASYTTGNIPSPGIVVESTQTIVFDQIPSNITNGSLVDFLQTRPGHKIREYDILIPSSGISGTSIAFTATDVPADLVVGDYVCSQNECIIPQVPPELHNGLAERAAARVLAAMGDQAGLAAANAKIAEIAQREGTLLDNRVDGSPRKITNKHSLLRFGRIGTRRRF